MIPTAEVEVSTDIPKAAEFWVPKPSDIDEEGFSYFRGVWPIVGAQSRLTFDVIEAERRGVAYIDEHAGSDEEFEILAGRVEALSDDTSDPDDLALLHALCVDGADWPGLCGLEIGVAGLVYALSNAGFYPAASCRSHYSQSWSSCPVVLFAADEERVKRLKPVVQESHCGFELDTMRSELLAINASTITAMMDLATALFARRGQFRSLPKTARVRSKISRPKFEQPFLF